MVVPTQQVPILQKVKNRKLAAGRLAIKAGDRIVTDLSHAQPHTHTDVVHNVDDNIGNVKNVNQTFMVFDDTLIINNTPYKPYKK